MGGRPLQVGVVSEVHAPTLGLLTLHTSYRYLRKSRGRGNEEGKREGRERGRGREKHTEEERGEEEMRRKNN